MSKDRGATMSEQKKSLFAVYRDGDDLPDDEKCTCSRSQENFHADRDCPQHGIDTPAGRSGVTTEEVKSTWRVSPPSGPAPSGYVVFYRGWVGYPDGSRSDVERWVRHADGGWLSLDTSRRESGDIVLDE